MTDIEFFELEIFADNVSKACASGRLLSVLDKNKYGAMAGYLNNLKDDVDRALERAQAFRAGDLAS